MKKFKIRKYADEDVSTPRYAIYVYNDIVNEYLFYMGNLSTAYKNALIEQFKFKGWVQS